METYADQCDVSNFDDSDDVQATEQTTDKEEMLESCDIFGTAVGLDYTEVELVYGAGINLAQNLIWHIYFKSPKVSLNYIM